MIDLIIFLLAPFIILGYLSLLGSLPLLILRRANLYFISPVLGLCIVLYYLRLEFYFSIPKSVTVWLIYLFPLASILYCIITKSKKYYIAVSKCLLLDARLLLPLFVTSCLILLPYIFGIAFFVHQGPDLIGYLLSESYQYNGGNLRELLNTFELSSGHTEWWFPYNSWNFPDFRQSVAIEFFLRAARFGFQGQAVFISVLTGIDLWKAHIVAIELSLVLFVYYLLLSFRKEITSTWMHLTVTVLVLSSPFIAVLYFESIHAQIISMGYYASFFLLISKYCTKHVNVKTNILIAFILLTASTVFAEGLQIIIASAGFILPIAFITYLRNKSLVLKNIILNILTIGCFTFLFDVIYTVIFSGWTYLRAVQGFPGGALHIPLNPISFLFQLGIVKNITADSLQFSYDWGGGALVATTVLFVLFGMYRLILKNDIVPLFISAPFIPAVYMSNYYAVFKVGTFFIYFYLCYLLFFLDVLKKFNHYIYIIFLAILLSGNIDTIEKFVRFAKRIPISSLEFIKSNSALFNMCRYTTESPGHYYFIVGAYSKVLYQDSGWGPNFNLGPQYNCLLVYNDCELEPNHCEKSIPSPSLTFKGK